MRDAITYADVVVVGAGPGGSTTAAHLASLGHDVLLVEKAATRFDLTNPLAIKPKTASVDSTYVDRASMPARHVTDLAIPPQWSLAVSVPLGIDLAHEATLDGFVAEPLAGFCINGS